MGTYEVVGENVELVVATEVVVIFIIVVKEVGGADVVVDVDIGKLSFVVLIQLPRISMYVHSAFIIYSYFE